MTESDFDRLMQLYQKGLLTGKEKEWVDKWLHATADHSEVNFDKTDQERLKLKILLEVRQSRETGRHLYVYKIAASVAIFALSALIWYHANIKPQPVVLTASSSDSITKVVLSDGTLVWLKGNSTLTYPSDLSGTTRHVSLRGEALFEVAKDSLHPFVIQCGDLTTTVLGTSFNIKSEELKIEVLVLTGKVNLTSTDDKQGVVVLPNETVVYDGKQKLLSKEATALDVQSQAVNGTEYQMTFEDTRMTDVVRRIEEKFDVKISHDKAALDNCMITADFSDQSLESTLHMISQALKYEYEIKDRQVVLTGRGCD